MIGVEMNAPVTIAPPTLSKKAVGFLALGLGLLLIVAVVHHDAAAVHHDEQAFTQLAAVSPCRSKAPGNDCRNAPVDTCERYFDTQLSSRKCELQDSTEMCEGVTIPSLRIEGITRCATEPAPATTTPQFDREKFEADVYDPSEGWDGSHSIDVPVSKMRKEDLYGDSTEGCLKGWLQDNGFSCSVKRGPDGGDPTCRAGIKSPTGTACCPRSCKTRDYGDYGRSKRYMAEGYGDYGWLHWKSTCGDSFSDSSDFNGKDSVCSPTYAAEQGDCKYFAAPCKLDDPPPAPPAPEPTTPPAPTEPTVSPTKAPTPPGYTDGCSRRRGLGSCASRRRRANPA